MVPEPTNEQATTVPERDPKDVHDAVCGSDTPSGLRAPHRDAFSAPANRERIGFVGLVVLLVVFVAFLGTRFHPAIQAPDANGYWAQGTLLAQTGKLWFEPEVAPQYIGMHWLVTEDGRYFSRYPPGLGSVVSVVYRLLGYRASVAVNPALAVLALIGFYLLLRGMDLRWPWALLGVAALMTTPSFARHALVCDSHMAIVFLLTWGLFFLMRWSEHGRHIDAFVGGLFLGSIPTVRYPEALYALGIGAFLLLNWRRQPRIWTHYAAAVAGAVVPLIPLVAYHHASFGAAWKTAYSLTNEQTGFSWAYFRAHCINYIRQLHGEGMGLLFPFGILGMVLMCADRKRRPLGWLCVLSVVPVILLYMAYYWAPERMASATMRFVLPTFVCFCAAAVWGLERLLSQASSRTRGIAVCVILAIQIAWGVPSMLEETRQSAHARHVLATITSQLEQEAKPGAVVMAPPQILQNIDFVGKWRLMDLTMLRGTPMMGRFSQREKDSSTPAPMQMEKRAIQAEKYEGQRPFERERSIAWDISEWAGEQKVYYVGPIEELEQLSGLYFNEKNMHILTRFTLPEAPKQREREGMMGAGVRGPNRGAPGPQQGMDGRPDGAMGMMHDRLGGGPPPFQGMDGRPDGAMGGMRDRFGGGARNIGGRRGRGGGGPMQMGTLLAAKEIIVAEWTWVPGM